MVPIVVPSRGIDVDLTCADIAPSFPEYGLVRELGGGTFKIACLVRDGDEEVVLKVSKEVVDPESGGLPERLRREIEAMKRVDNPHVAKVLDGPAVRQVVGGQRVYYLEPYYEGGTLTKHLGDPWDATRLIRSPPGAPDPK